MRKSGLALGLMAGALLAGAVWAGEVVHKVGKLTWHPAGYVGKVLAMKGYVLQAGDGYVLFSDEPGGAISAHDLPVQGTGFDQMKPGTLYLLHGTFVKGGLKASNGNPYHLDLTAPPEPLH
ncbi:hypothetical protein GC209_02585 [bacterium]|nr:hypothetical protein [bacterium]